MNMKDGSFGGFPNIWEWENPVEALFGIGKIFGVQKPKGGSGGRVGFGTLKEWGVGAVVGLVIEVVKWGFEKEVERANRVRDEIYNICEEVVKDTWMDAIIVKENDREGEEPEDSGQDFILFLNEVARKLESEKTWKQILSGTLPPEQNDVREEFAFWLNQHGANSQPITDRRPLSEDETGYSFAYWCWRTFANGMPRESRFLNYLWRKGAPIDPVNPPVGMNGNISYVGGKYDAKSGKLKLSFLG
jgi:hypothetical protein